MNEMGMTNKQFNGFLRFIKNDLEDALEFAQDDSKKEELIKKLERLLENVQSTMED